MTMTGSINHSGDYVGKGNKKIKKKKIRHGDMVIDTIVAFSPSAVFPLRAFRVRAEETK